MRKIKHSYDSAAANTTGLASNVTGASWTLSANDAGDGLAHLITIKNDAVTNHSGKTAVISGTGPSGEAQEETLNLPGSAATVTSTKYFQTVTSVTPSATIGSDTMDIGWAAGAVSPWFAMRTPRNDAQFQVGFGVSVDSGSPTYTVQHSYGDGVAFNHSSVASKSANASGEYQAPISSIRLSFSAAGAATLTAIQSGV